MARLRVRPITSEDHDTWQVLFEEYREFCGRSPDPEICQTVWEWLMRSDPPVHGLVAERDGAVVAIAHYRTFARTVDANEGLHLDDLYVAREARGNGTAKALLDHMGELARDTNAQFVRWVTAEDNERARQLYEQVADETSWVTFELQPG